MNLNKRKKFAEMIFFLGWKRHKDDVYTPQSILDLVHQNMDFIQSRPFLESVYLRIFGLDNPFTRSRDVFILIFWIKLKDEFDLIYRRLFNNNKEDFVNFYYPIIHKLYRYHHFVDRRTLNIDFWVNPKGCESNDIDAFPDFSLPPYWKESLGELDQGIVIDNVFNYNEYWELFLQFLSFLYLRSHSLVGGQLNHSHILTKNLENRIKNLGFCYAEYFFRIEEILEIFIHINFKNEIRLLYQLLTSWLHREKIENSEKYFAVLFGGGLFDTLNTIQRINEESIEYECLFNKEEIYPLLKLEDWESSSIRPGRYVELVDRREFFRRFWEIPDL